MILPLEIHSGSALSSNQSELTKTTIMTTNIWPIQPSLPKQVDTIYIGEGMYDQDNFQMYNVYIYIPCIPMLSLQTSCSNSHTQVQLTGAGNTPTFLYWYIHSKRTIDKLELLYWNKMKQVITVPNNGWFWMMRLMMLMDPPYKTSQIGGDVIKSHHRSPRNMLNKTAGLQREWFWLKASHQWVSATIIQYGTV